MTIQPGRHVDCQTAAPATASRHRPQAQALQAPELTLTQLLDGEQPEHQARDLTGRVLAILGIDPDTTYQAQLAVQELATNARRHAPAPRELHVTIRASDVRIAVTDADPRHETVTRLLAAVASSQPEQDASLLSESGRGLQIIATLFPGACGAGPAYLPASSPEAKQVWISIPLPDPAGDNP
jgi:anti-sigma regulatory factor (Ser/Thr protein kinase)